MQDIWTFCVGILAFLPQVEYWRGPAAAVGTWSVFRGSKQLLVTIETCQGRPSGTKSAPAPDSLHCAVSVFNLVGEAVLAGWGAGYVEMIMEERKILAAKNDIVVAPTTDE